MSSNWSNSQGDRTDNLVEETLVFTEEKKNSQVKRQFRDMFKPNHERTESNFSQILFFLLRLQLSYTAPDANSALRWAHVVSGEI